MEYIIDRQGIFDQFRSQLHVFPGGRITSYNVCYTKLLRDGVVADSPIAADFALQNDEYKSKLKIVGTPFTDEWLGIAVKKGDEATLKILNEGLEKIKADGTLDAISSYNFV